MVGSLGCAGECRPTSVLSLGQAFPCRRSRHEQGRPPCTACPPPRATSAHARFGSTCSAMVGMAARLEIVSSRFLVHLLRAPSTFRGDKYSSPHTLVLSLGNLSCGRCGTASNQRQPPGREVVARSLVLVRRCLYQIGHRFGSVSFAWSADVGPPLTAHIGTAHRNHLPRHAPYGHAGTIWCVRALLGRSALDVHPDCLSYGFFSSSNGSCVRWSLSIRARSTSGNAGSPVTNSTGPDKAIMWTVPSARLTS